MRYILGFLGIVIVGILAIVLVTSGGDSKPASDAKESVKKVVLTDYISGDSSVRFTTEGVINAQEEHRSIRVTITPTRRSVEILKGYNYEVESSKVFSNSQAAYDEFLHALQTAGFTRRKEKPLQEDEKGVCSTGNRYIYELLSGGQEVSRTWGTSCSAKQGTSASSSSLVHGLFEDQIPEYRDLTRDVDI